MTTKKKVFVSFDFDNDEILKIFLIGQSKLEDSPFEVIDYSMKEAAPEKDWEEKAKAKIKASDIVIVMVGLKTYKASGVLKEVKIANGLEKKIVQMIGHKDGNYTRVEGAGTLYSWNWENLKKLLA
ncbi:MAG: TIR domain-containing protein [Bacteroidales bacterium]